MKWKSFDFEVSEVNLANVDNILFLFFFFFLGGGRVFEVFVFTFFFLFELS